MKGSDDRARKNKVLKSVCTDIKPNIYRAMTSKTHTHTHTHTQTYKHTPTQTYKHTHTVTPLIFVFTDSSFAVSISQYQLLNNPVETQIYFNYSPIVLFNLKDRVGCLHRSPSTTHLTVRPPVDCFRNCMTSLPIHN